MAIDGLQDLYHFCTKIIHNVSWKIGMYKICFSFSVDILYDVRRVRGEMAGDGVRQGTVRPRLFLRDLFQGVPL